ncbi:hypothetical protein JDV02_008436 [Purpureocillium takamizusanense]|uniref:Uncharacterized protein n=1 Tax=Purpureocillium takamizusanense TaxID=2060973 RepID=A0A9Q8QNP1_9HYPO|nr:uncharacterized protein JDV02_008436 [Purpureocillium takamizusanense]UNI22557.1 hypothetical protein JDV02_008436 [Purpureocillium takamizusanense]
MPAINETEYGSLSQSPYGILRILGGWGNVSGPGLVMFRSMIAGTSTAMILGITASMASSLIWGTATLPFVVFSSLGFALGSARWYMVSSQEALLQLRRYPALLRMHIVANFPWLPEYAARDLAWFTPERFAGGWVRRSVLVAGWLSAQPALDELHSQVQAAIVQKYVDEAPGDSEAQAVHGTIKT